MVVATDQLANEISWSLEGSGSTIRNSAMTNNQEYITVICVDSADYHAFTINDSYGDGIIGAGGFTVNVDTALELTSSSNGNGWTSLTTEFGSCSAPTPTAPTQVTSYSSGQLEVDVEVTTDSYTNEIRYIFLSYCPTFVS